MSIRKNIAIGMILGGLSIAASLQTVAKQNEQSFSQKSDVIPDSNLISESPLPQLVIDHSSIN